MIGKKLLGLVTLVVAMLAIFGCEDFESGEFGYDITFKSTEYNIVKMNEDNTALVEVRSLIVVDTLYNETLENSVIELGDVEQRPTIEKRSDSEYLFTAQFDNVPLREKKRVLLRVSLNCSFDIIFSISYYNSNYLYIQSYAYVRIASAIDLACHFTIVVAASFTTLEVLSAPQYSTAIIGFLYFCAISISILIHLL